MDDDLDVTYEHEFRPPLEIEVNAFQPVSHTQKLYLSYRLPAVYDSVLLAYLSSFFFFIYILFIPFSILMLLHVRGREE